MLKRRHNYTGSGVDIVMPKELQEESRKDVDRSQLEFDVKINMKNLPNRINVKDNAKIWLQLPSAN